MPSIDMIFVTKHEAADLKYQQLESIVMSLWEKAAIVT
jgi:ribonuclease P protein component